MNNIKIPNRFSFCFASLKGLFFACIRKSIGIDRFKRKRYIGKRIMSPEEANNLLFTMITRNEPFVAARFGDGELRTAVHFLEKKEGIRKKYPDYIRKAICNNAGFFPNEENMIDRFSETLLTSTFHVDVLAVWFNYLEDYVYQQFGPLKKHCITLKDYEPFWYSNPWTKALQGKKVLVIHPFAETIEQQYAKKDLLFDNGGILPDFELITLKSVQSIGGQSEDFDTWFSALEEMYNKAIAIDFDIAIIGCGAYGLPLAAKLKQFGKMAIHLGGVTQFVFGIKGKRWDAKPEYAKFYNDHWVRPGEQDIPKNANSVENGCYW